MYSIFKERYNLRTRRENCKIETSEAAVSMQRGKNKRDSSFLSIVGVRCVVEEDLEDKEDQKTRF